jgi:hypothetical protein
MMFLKRWFAYNKITQGEMHEEQASQAAEGLFEAKTSALSI